MKLSPEKEGMFKKASIKFFYGFPFEGLNFTNYVFLVKAIGAFTGH